VRNEPLTIHLGQEHGEPRGRGHRLAVGHASKLIGAGHDHRVVIDYDRSPFLNFVLVAASRQFQVREIGMNRITALGNNRAVRP
jgi:hypothetical protein